MRPITLKALLAGGALRRLEGKHYFFCPASDCDVVYFSEDGHSIFRKADVTVRIGVKETEDPIPICYCFGISESDIREEAVLRGRSAIYEEVAGEVRAGHCACEVRNPSGSCCLNEIARALRR